MSVAVRTALQALADLEEARAHVALAPIEHWQYVELTTAVARLEQAVQALIAEAQKGRAA